MSGRRGIAAGGNWIVDRVKTVDRLPARGMLGSILSENASTGGGPANVLFDLSRLGAPFPLTGLGVVGEDDDGRFILQKAQAHHVDTAHIARTTDAQTSYTDVMNETGSGDRMFFHNRGANARFGPAHVPVDKLSCRIFHLAYLLLLDTMDTSDAEFGTTAARLLHALRVAGIKTSVDVVSEESDRFGTLVPPALRHTDYLILNEVEAGRTVGRAIRGENHALDAAALDETLEELCGLGQMELVAIHMPEGFCVRDRSGARHARGSLVLPDGFVRGSVGAGDAFCAGMLYGLHEGWEPADAGWLGTCCAAACLSNANATDGVGPLDNVLELGKTFPERDPPLAA